MPTLQSYYTPAVGLVSASSNEMAQIITDETGTGSVVFSNDPDFTGTPTAPTASPGDNSTNIATTEYVNYYVNNKITVSDTEPVNPSVDDIWIDTSA